MLAEALVQPAFLKDQTVNKMAYVAIALVAVFVGYLVGIFSMVYIMGKSEKRSLIKRGGPGIKG